MRRRLVAVGWVIAGMAAPPAQAGTAFGKTGDWEVERNEGTCSLSKAYTARAGGGVTLLSIEYDDRLGGAIVSFNDPTVKSLKDNADKRIRMTFVKGNRLDEGWGESAFSVRSYEGGAFFAKKFTKELLDDLASSTIVGFFYGDVLLQSYGLDGSREGVALLRRCAADESRLHPSDPFA